MDEIVLSAQPTADGLVFIFHGYGADKDDMRHVGKEFSKALPTVEIHLPNGIEECDEGFGRQWFPLEGNDIEVWKSAFAKNSEKIMSRIDSIVSEKKLSYGEIILAGFSQGAMLSLSLGLKYGVKAVVAFSGLLLNPEFCAGKNGCCSTKILLTHGGKDEVIPIRAAMLTEEALRKANLSVRTAISPNLSHGIDDYLLNQAVDFLKEL
jgi:phospholipase/carboxylesterase